MAESEITIQRYDPRLLNPDKAEVKVDGNGNWDMITNESGNARAEHILVLKGDKILFDKLLLVPGRAVFVLPARLNPDGHMEFLLMNEYALTLGYELLNIPSGSIKDGEAEPAAARRELKEETGYEPTDLLYIGRQILDPAHENVFHPFYLAIIPYQQIPKNQDLDEAEKIKILPWRRMEDIRGLGTSNGKVTIALSLAERVIKTGLL